MTINHTVETHTDKAPAVEPAKLEVMKEQAKGTNIVLVTPEEKPKAPQVDPNRPAWLPEKFKTPEDFAKSYAELEKKQGSAPKLEVPPTTETPKTEPAKGLEALKIEGATTDKAAELAVAKAGLDIKALSAEYQQNGDLKPESYKALEATGITKDVVNLYIEGQKALQEKLTNDLYSVAGGADQFQAMHQWSVANLAPAEAEAVNKAIDSGDASQIKLAFQGVHAKYVAAEGQAPKVQLRGTANGGSVGDTYPSMAHMQADIANPTYQLQNAIGEAFRKNVFDKLKRSNLR